MKRRRGQKKSIDRETETNSENTPRGSRINWFPGHMAKAQKQVKDSLKKVNLVFEIRDARAPLTSGNFSLHQLLGQKKRLIILNKVNLAPPGKVMQWTKWFEAQGVPFIFLNSFNKSSLNKLLPKARAVFMRDKTTQNQVGKLRVMILGLPNTGKSTIINHLVGKKATRAANKPGLTQAQQWVSLGQGVELLDTPGIMPPSIPTDEQGHWLCAIHAIKDDILGEDTVSLFMIDYLLQVNPSILTERYGLEDLSGSSVDILLRLAKKRNFIRQKGELDFERATKLILQEFRKGDLGPICFESPPASETPSSPEE